METWKVEEDHLVALIYEINRLGQSLLEFDEKEYSNYFSSRLAEIALGMLGADGASADPNGEGAESGDGVKSFDAGKYSILFNFDYFLNENLLREALAEIRQNCMNSYKAEAQITENGSPAAWQIEEKLIIDLIRELARLGGVMAKTHHESYDTYFATRLPDIVLDMLGIPESYSGTIPEDMLKEKEDRPEHPAAYSRGYDYDIFNYVMHEDRLKKYLAYKREHQDEYRRIRAVQAKLGDRLNEPDGYDWLMDEMLNALKSKKS